MKPHVNQTFSLTIHGLGSSGEGVGSFNGYTVFVPGALPGEIVEVRLSESHQRYGVAKLLNILEPSRDRVAPPCPLFGECGGCQLMHLSYPKQLEMKRQRVVDALLRIGKIDTCEVAPCLPSPSVLAYRNKIQLPARKKEGGIALGLYARASHELIEVESCLIHCALGEEVYRAVRSLIKQLHIAPYDPATGQGELRHVLIKSGMRTQEALVILVTNQNKSPLLSRLAQEIIQCHPAVKGVVHNLNRERDNVILGDHYEVLEGAGSIQEVIGDLTFHISPASFFQINPAQAEHLYAKALEYADLTGRETVLDAYCGVGTLALFFAKHAKQVIGVESVRQAIQDASANAARNGITNATFICDTAEHFIASLSHVDLVLLNPPRKGCAPSFLEGIKRLSPPQLIYISCDPATLARDLAQLHTCGYRTEAIQPFDMFPQTAHVECVAKLTK